MKGLNSLRLSVQTAAPSAKLRVGGLELSLGEIIQRKKPPERCLISISQGLGQFCFAISTCTGGLIQSQYRIQG